MSFLSVAHSDVGIKKSVNQDSVLVKEAITDDGNIILAVVCDGMGGLAKGEVASAALIRAFSHWFESELPFLLYEEGRLTELTLTQLENAWINLIHQVNQRIMKYGESFHASCGTTLAGLLIAGNHYYIVNVGDSRVYLINDVFEQITKDHTLVQRELDEGKITLAEAKVHPQRNVLLQCVGASTDVMPEFFEGDVHAGDIFMICSDGFRHEISEEEFFKILQPDKLIKEKDMQDAVVYCTELNKQRRETDNISAVLIKSNR